MTDCFCKHFTFDRPGLARCDNCGSPMKLVSVAAYEKLLEEWAAAERDIGILLQQKEQAYQWGCEWRDQYKKLAALSGHLVVDPPDEPEW